MSIRAKHAREIRRGFSIARALLTLTNGDKRRTWWHVQLMTEEDSLARRAALAVIVAHNSDMRHHKMTRAVITPERIEKQIKLNQETKTQKKGGR